MVGFCWLRKFVLKGLRGLRGLRCRTVGLRSEKVFSVYGLDCGWDFWC